jgi:uracil-DNA glycosylase
MELNPKWTLYFNNLLSIDEAYQKIQDEAYGKKIFPPKNQIFNAFSFFEPKQLKVVIIGQDPYHKEGQANGLSFSVNKSISIPPSLKNIYKELKNDIGCEIPDNGDLTKWAEQGVLLLNSVLTVYEAMPNDKTHRIIWEPITEKLIERISEMIPNIVFILWGQNAIKKRKVIKNQEGHLILEGGHPSPLNRHIKKNFFNQRFFSKANQYLIENGKDPIDWQI